MTRIAIYRTSPAPETMALYGDLLEQMLAPHMGGASFEHFNVALGEFPTDPTAFDGVAITGSPSMVTDGDAWIATLFEHIRILDASRTKIFAICFGHQAVSAALGGKVEHRDIVLGSPATTILKSQPWMSPERSSLNLFAGNFQQVVEVPDALEVIASHPDCPNAAMVKGDHILTLQFHPELSADYMHSYVDDTADVLPDAVVKKARAQIDGGSDGQVFARWAASFLKV